MPHFFGSLKASPNQEELKKLLDTSDKGVTGPKPDLAQTVKDAPPNAGALTPSHTEGAEGKKKQNVLAETWQPSGGKKLSTGLMLAISNAAAGITRPCVLDVKLGARLWDDAAPVAKRQKLDEVSNSTTSGSLGFRVAGMKVWVGADVEQAKEEHCENKDGYKTYTKMYGRAFTKETVKGAFESFLGGLDGAKLKRKHAKLVRDRIIRELESIEYTLQNEESRMYSASILMIYEGDNAALEKALEVERDAAVAGHEEDEDEDHIEDDEDDEDDDSAPKVHNVCLIDFAHAKFEAGMGPDENALQGVRSVLGIMKSLG